MRYDHEPVDATERMIYADRVLARPEYWPAWWSRDDQLKAYFEGWCITVFKASPVQPEGKSQPHSSKPRIRSTTSTSTDTMIAHVIERANEGSDLHRRALVLHTATVLMYGNSDAQSS